eukprot:gnl/TRDRNA2_/TRDRNA2_190391_c0_seq1.p1 gnl/TRDRNA2_/TRDRNA2_190391_c0~~gnl/TRDRNA2_/TRDRNA2_190391_c0_seq1.p1  ORF type:complete len:374 (-),score=85.38 gnl/TRDRNA2_/TRDRNA2_190391_c0_seq1:46-1167(-)
MALRFDAAGNGMSHSSGSSSAIKRIQRELKEIMDSPSRHWIAAPVNDDLFEWQFALRGPPDSDYEGGIYTGRLALPVNYPMAPPTVMLLTPNGRWEVNKKICLSNSSYHPELWQPAWGIRTMMEALRCHFPTPGDGAIGAIDFPSDVRRKLAKESLDFISPGGSKKNRDLLPFLTPEELREDGGPEPPPWAAAEAAAAAEAVAQTAVEEPQPQPTAAAWPPEQLSYTQPAPQAAVQFDESPEGLRQRYGGGTAAPPQAGWAPPSPQNQGFASPYTHEVPPAAVPQPVYPSYAAPPSEPAPPPRRRRDENSGRGQQRRPQRSFISQVLKLPWKKRDWMLIVVDTVIFALTVSSTFLVVDLVKTPPPPVVAALQK